MRFVLGPVFRYDDAMKNPNQRLLDLMTKHELTQVDLTILCQCSRTTVHYWTRNPDNPDFMEIKGAYMRLLELELGEAKRQSNRGINRRNK